MKNGTCLKCGSKKVMENIEVRDEGKNSSHPLQVMARPREPKRGLVIITSQSMGELSAWICADCGYTELYTDNLSNLYEAYNKNR
jgi:predicted nucleic-acid-binding Zn-ribbon protein